MITKTFNITGMSCAACSASVTRVVSKLEGVTECDVNLITGKMTVTFDNSRTNENNISRAVEKAGFGISAENSKSASRENKEKTSIYPIIISAIFSGVLLFISMGTMLFEELRLPSFIDPVESPYNFALTQILLCVPTLYYGRIFFIKGLPLLFHGRPNMDSLVAVGALASLIYSIVVTYTIPHNSHAIHNLYYESVAVVITLVMLGKTLEAKSRDKTLSAIKALMELTPETAIISVDGKEKTVLTENVKVGDILVVKAGSKFPLDGVIVKGETSVDESMLTGESLPLLKAEGDSVTGGSINLNGLVLVKVTRIGKETTLSRIISFVEEAQSKKAPISKTADRVAGIFVPIVMAVAIISAVIWLIFSAQPAFALKIFTSVLVVACPCSLGLATPTAMMVGTGLGAKNGILIRNGEVLETAHKITAAVFDKTGTVTKGKPLVTDIETENESELLALAFSAEQGSVHPISIAIRKKAEEKGLKLLAIDSFEDFSGKGVMCKISGQKILVGSRELLEENGIKIPETNDGNLAAQGKSIIYVSRDDKFIGLLAVADTLKEASAEAFGKLKKMNIKTILLSGDNRPCAEFIGKELGADEIYSEIKPAEKAQIIEKIKAKYGTTLMVGDGINDAPALAAADVGCAIGSGSDVAIESADIVLMKSDPLDVAKAINLSCFTVKNIKQNLFWAFCYNTVCIPIAAGVLYPMTGLLLSPMLAGLAMSLSSVFVVGNALRLGIKGGKL